MSYKAYNKEGLGFTTRQLHAGYNPEEHYRSKAVPIYQTAVFELGDYERCVRLFEYAEEGHSYVRFSNPTNQVLEERLASLEGGAAAVTFGSGMGAISSTLLNLAHQGDEIIAVQTLYGGSTKLFNNTFKDYGIQTRYVEDENDIEAYRELITDKTKAIYLECIGNPSINIIDVEAVTSLAHEYGIPVVMDNTFATPYLFQAFDYGVDIVCYSATKYLSGHGVVIAGIAVEKGGFDWLNGRFPEFEEFYKENVAQIGEEVLKREMFTKRLRMRYLTDLGAHMSPQTAFYVLQGLETLSLRMDRHVENAGKIAKFLEEHPAVKAVSYPGLESSPYYELSKKYFPKGPGAMMAIRVNGGQEAALRVLEQVEIFDYMVNVGDAKSLIVHPASSTHFGHSEEELISAGVYPDTLRLSIGIEDAKDLIADLDQALNAALEGNKR
ncbi:MAG: O-acetylhomoserine aminocarboxypropyltransferase/cysteine synthase [Lachnospiraceae bacterium]|nr:O-acetylhomoserine aminocarboxypropyltransferase/cysteine synthase [Lachnospiraceae bacterium]